MAPDEPEGGPHREGLTGSLADTGPLRPDTGPGQPPRSRAPVHPPGTLVANRFRIVRWLGQGGMGQVYEAEDEELRHRVALKTLPANPELGEEAALRLRREALLALRVTHVNVCRTFGLFRDDSESGSSLVIAMELLSGETLHERIRRNGPMTPAEALPIAAQMAAALEVAHEAGVIHCDFKSANVMLMGASGGSRAVVMDFGVAAARPTPDAGPTDALPFLGTPAYMAPEQIEGEPVSPATDVFALGIVLHEMVTGTLPFPSVLARLEGPPPPSPRAPSLDARWESVIQRCLERDPKRRFTSPREVVNALAAEPVRARHGRRRLLAVAASALLLGLAGAWALTRSAPEPRPGRRSIAVLGLRNLSPGGQNDWLSTAIAEMLATELAAGDELRAVAGESVAQMKSDLSLPAAEEYSAPTLLAIRRHLGSDLVVLGAFMSAPSDLRLRVDLRVQDTSLARTVASVTETGTEADLLALVARAGRRLRLALGVSALTPDQESAARALRPANPSAARAYAQGLSDLRHFNANAARQALESAIEADPGYPLAHAALAEAWRVLNHGGRAREAARRAFELAAGLPPRERSWIEAQYRLATGDWPRAAEILKGLVEFYPDEVDFWLALVEAQLRDTRVADAKATIERARALPPPASNDPRIDLSVARIETLGKRFSAAEEAALAAAAKAEARGARLLLATARLRSAEIARLSGSLDQAIRRATVSAELFDASGDRVNAARARSHIALALTAEGRWEESRRVQDRIRALRDEGEVRGGLARVLHVLGMSLYGFGDLEASRPLLEAAAEIDREVGNVLGAMAALNLGTVLLERGELAEARSDLERTVEEKEQAGDSWGAAMSRAVLADVRFQQGDLSDSRRLLQSATRSAHDTHQRGLAVEWQVHLGQTLVAAGDTAGGRAILEEAVAAAGDTDAGGASLALAVLCLDAGCAGRTEAAARAALDRARRQRAPAAEPFAEIESLMILAESQMAQQSPAAARSSAGEARRLLSGCPECRLRHAELGMIEARIEAASGGADSAASALLALVKEADASGWRAQSLAARLALAEVDAARADAGWQARAAALFASARRLGFGRIARRASALRVAAKTPQLPVPVARSSSR
jgi:eukaryotic-like serine/threonine-protein kinase